MNLLKAILLGIIQGVTEFLPISSSGHLVIIQKGIYNLEQSGLTFDILLHVATLCAILLYFRKNITYLFKSFLNLEYYKHSVNLITNPTILNNVKDPKILEAQSTLFFILIASIPTAIIGFAFKDIFEDIFTKVSIVGLMLVVTGLILWIADYKTRSNNQTLKKLTVTNALIIGLFQGLAIMPGISRSGATIAAGIFCGLDRNFSAEFSFLIAIPAILGALFLEIHKLSFTIMNGELLLTYLAGMLMAGIVGYLSLKTLFSILKHKKLAYFSYYCWIVGITTILYFQWA
ncbi:MAG: undecaprenyl-diphosphate phosphatase [bacterium]